jgi:hypothetical protein
MDKQKNDNNLKAKDESSKGKNRTVDKPDDETIED